MEKNGRLCRCPNQFCTRNEKNNMTVQEENKLEKWMTKLLFIYIYVELL